MCHCCCPLPLGTFSSSLSPSCWSQRGSGQVGTGVCQELGMISPPDCSGLGEDRAVWGSGLSQCPTGATGTPQPRGVPSSVTTRLHRAQGAGAPEFLGLSHFVYLGRISRRTKPGFLAGEKIVFSFFFFNLF